MNLLGYQDQMGYFAHSRSKEQTQILIRRYERHINKIIKICQPILLEEY